MQYVSSISTSRGQPRWNELVRIAIPWSLSSLDMQYPNDRFSQLETLIDNSVVNKDHIEPVKSSSQRSSGDSAIFSRRNPTSAHLRFVVRHRSTISGLYFESVRDFIVFMVQWSFTLIGIDVCSLSAVLLCFGTYPGLSHVHVGPISILGCW